jgi:hypothetical protein
MSYKTLSVDSKIIEIINALKKIGGYDTTQQVLDLALSLLMLANGERVGDKMLLRTADGKEYPLLEKLDEALHQHNHKLYAKTGASLPEHQCDMC